MCEHQSRLLLITSIMQIRMHIGIKPFENINKCFMLKNFASFTLFSTTSRQIYLRRLVVESIYAHKCLCIILLYLFEIKLPARFKVINYTSQLIYIYIYKYILDVMTFLFYILTGEQFIPMYLSLRCIITPYIVV